MNRILQYASDKLKGKPESLRSPKWDKVRKAHLIRENKCQWCGMMDGLEVHHIQPFHIDPSLELQDWNLITLCVHCHLVCGHNCNWKSSNPFVKTECKSHNGH